MAGEWNTMPLEDCMAAIIDYRGKTPEKTTFGVPLVTAKVIKGGRIERPDEFIAEADFDGWMRRGMPMPGDIVMTTEAPLGEIAQLDGAKVALAQRVITLRGKADLLDNTFLKFLLQSRPVQEELRSRATGTTVLGIRQSELRKVNLTLPPLPEQRAIAHVLGALDDMIEVNREINETLEEMARALFKSWFVDFDPVRAKLEGRPPAGMDAATAALFPDHFQDSDLGQIPKGWEVVNVGAIAEQSIGGQWGEDLPAEGLVPAICLRGCDMEDLRKSGNSARAPIRFIKPQALEKRSMQNCDFLIASSGAGPCGRPLWCSPNLQSMHQYEAIYSNFVKRFTAPSRAHAIFLDRLFQEKFDDDSIWDYINGTSVPNLDANGLLGGYKITLPPVAILEAYSDYCIPIFELLYSGESRDLAALRDTLLPKLLSGEVSVKEAKEVVL